MATRLTRSALQLAAAAVAVLTSLPSAAVNVVVPGDTNLNLAGRAAGYTCCFGDSVGNEDPALVAGLTLVSGQMLTFTVTGQTSHAGVATTGNNPDGDAFSDSPGHFGDGISAPVNVDRINALTGLFLSDASPTGATTPARIDHAGDLAFTTLAPLVGQIFFIGNGLTGDTMAGDFGGSTQTFTVPEGATRLYLGSTDAFGWYNNSGQFDVAIGVVPEPAAALTMLGGLAGVAAAVLRRRRRAQG